MARVSCWLSVCHTKLAWEALQGLLQARLWRQVSAACCNKHDRSCRCRRALDVVLCCAVPCHAHRVHRLLQFLRLG